VSTAALSIVLAPGVLSAAVPPGLARSTAAAVLPGGAPATVLALAETAAGGVITAKATAASVVLLSAGLLFAGLGLGGSHEQAPDGGPERLAPALPAPPPEPCCAALTPSNPQDQQEPQAIAAPPRRRGFPLAITIARVLIRRLDSEEEHCLVEAELPPGVIVVPVDHEDAPWALDLLLRLLAEPALHWQVLDHHERGPPPG
jgi:hypothetical protein